MTGKTSETDSLDIVVKCLTATIGLLMVLHGIGRYSGIIPAEPAPAWGFIAIGLAMAAISTIE